MTWVKKAASGEVRFSVDAWLRIWVTLEDVQVHEKVVPIIKEYEQKRDELKASPDMSDNDKIKELKGIRKEYVDKLEAIKDEVISSCAFDIGSQASSPAGAIKLEFEVGDPDRGSLLMEDVLYGGWDVSESEELEIDEQ